MEELNNLIVQSILKLKELKKLVLSFRFSNDNTRIKTCIADIDRCIDHGDYYINDISLYNPNNFRFHSGLVNLTDTIRDNNFGLVLSEKEENEKQLFCNELIALVEKLIIVNNKFKAV